MAHPNPHHALGTSESRLTALPGLLSWLVAGVAVVASPAALRAVQVPEKIFRRTGYQPAGTASVHIATGRILMTGIDFQAQPIGRRVENGLPRPPAEPAAAPIPSQTASGVLPFGGISSAVVH